MGIASDFGKLWGAVEGLVKGEKTLEQTIDYRPDDGEPPGVYERRESADVSTSLLLTFTCGCGYSGIWNIAITDPEKVLNAIKQHVNGCSHAQKAFK